MCDHGELKGKTGCAINRVRRFHAVRYPSPDGRGCREAAGEGHRMKNNFVRYPSPGPSGHPLPSGEGFARLCLLLFILILAGCANSEYRFERTDGDKAVSIPMKFDSLYGARDGESVTAEARFSNGNDSAQMNVRLFLRPPAEFVSGTYRVTIDGKTVEGIVECQSLDYQGGQGSVPSMGGKFVLTPGYRIILPSTPIKRR